MGLVRDTKLEAQIQQRFGRKYKISNGKHGISYQVCCPFCVKNGHKQDKRFKLYITPGIGLYHCFVCGEANTIVTLFSDFKQIIEVQNDAILPLAQNIISPGRLVPLSSLSDEHVGIRYLKNRDVDPIWLQKHYGVMYCETGQLFGNTYNTTNTLIFPIVMDGKTVGWQSRLLYNPDSILPEQYPLFGFCKDEDNDYIIPPKYFTAPGMDKGRILFNYDNARKFNSVAICEGTFDAIKVGLNGVATLGKGVTDYQVRLIKAYWKFAIILLDPGDADSNMIKLEHDLRLSIPCVRIDLKGYKDAGETPTEEIWCQIIDTMKYKNIDMELLN